MVEQLKIVQPRSIGFQRESLKEKWKKKCMKLSVIAAGIYFKVMTSAPMVAFAKEASKTDTGVKDVTDGIDVIKDLVLGCVGGVGVIFLAWGLLDFGTAYAAHQTSEQSQAIKKVVGGLIMVAVPSILTLLGV